MSMMPFLCVPSARMRSSTGNNVAFDLGVESVSFDPFVKVVFDAVVSLCAVWSGAACRAVVGVCIKWEVAWGAAAVVLARVVVVVYYGAKA